MNFSYPGFRLVTTTLLGMILGLGASNARADLVTGVSYGEQVEVGGTISASVNMFLGSGLPLHTTQSVISSDLSAGGNATYDFLQTSANVDIKIATQYNTSSSCAFSAGEFVASPPTSSFFYFTPTVPLYLSMSTFNTLETTNGLPYGGCTVVFVLEDSNRVINTVQETGTYNASASYTYLLAPNVSYNFYQYVATGRDIVSDGSAGSSLFQLTLTPVPEPASLAILGLAPWLLLRARRR